MIFPTLFRHKYSTRFSSFCLSIALSALLSSSLIASHDLTGEGENKGLRGLKRLRENDQALETAPAAKIQKIEAPALHSDMIIQIFLPLSFPSVAAGQIVSKSWNQVLCSKKFCNLWGPHLAPLTPEAMAMTPPAFIRYFSRPSFQILDSKDFNNITINAMSADGSVLVGKGTDTSDYRYKAIKHTSKGWEALPFLNDGRYTSAYAINENGSIIAGSATDGENNDRETAVLWTEDGIFTLPFLNNDTPTKAKAINRDGAVIVGIANDYDDDEFDANDNKPAAVRWIVNKGKVEVAVLSSLKDEKPYSAEIISADGSTIVGAEMDGTNNARSIPVQWTDEIKELPSLNAQYHRVCTAINHDGSIRVGVEQDMTNRTTTIPVQWTKEGVTALPLLTATNKHGFVTAISANELVQGGTVYDTEYSKKTAVVWQDGKVNSLQALLEESSPLVKKSLQGAHLTKVDAINANGLQVAGMVSFNGNSFPFKAILPSTPKDS